MAKNIIFIDRAAQKLTVMAAVTFAVTGCGTTNSAPEPSQTKNAQTENEAANSC